MTDPKESDRFTLSPDLAARARNVAASRRVASPPQARPDKGDVCGTVPRRDGSELVVTIKEYEGRPYVSIGLWANGWPVKGKSVSVRMSELSGVLEALVTAAEKAGAR